MESSKGNETNPQDGPTDRNDPTERIDPTERNEPTESIEYSEGVPTGKGIEASPAPTGVFWDDQPTSDQTTSDQPTGDQPTGPVQDTVSPPARPRGPNASPLILGLVVLVLAAVVIAQETTGLIVDWSRLGPGGIVAIGFVMVAIGAIGLVRRHDDT
jgi:hypothetical protein